MFFLIGDALLNRFAGVLRWSIAGVTNLRWSAALRPAHGLTFAPLDLGSLIPGHLAALCGIASPLAWFGFADARG